MDKSLRVAKVNLMDMRKRIILFYIITSLVLMFFVRVGSFGDILLPIVMDLLTFLFLLSSAQNTMKNKFYFAQSNNISRKTFVKGNIISIFPIAALMSAVDFGLNRTMNVFIKAPTLYDLWFSNFGELTTVQERLNWVQDGSLGAIIGSIIFSFMLYNLASVIGLAIGVGNLVTSEKFQIIVSILSIGFWIIWFNIDDRFGILNKAHYFINNKDAWILLIYVLVFIICILESFRLIKKATINN